MGILGAGSIDAPLTRRAELSGHAVKGSMSARAFAELLRDRGSTSATTSEARSNCACTDLASGSPHF